MVRKLPREISDYNPLIIFSKISKKLPHIQFKFELSWVDNPDFKLNVKKIWNTPCNAKSSRDRKQQKLKLVKQYFKGWGFGLQGRTKEK